jgi:hypothetical protein
MRLVPFRFDARLSRVSQGVEIAEVRDDFVDVQQARVFVMHVEQVTLCVGGARSKVRSSATETRNPDENA